jgi:hypothetical protein
MEENKNNLKQEPFPPSNGSSTTEGEENKNNNLKKEVPSWDPLHASKGLCEEASVKKWSSATHLLPVERVGEVALVTDDK